MELLIDVVGSCNLKCPSCPVGNSPQILNAKGAMTKEKLEAILLKARKECTVESVALFNWTDPLVHPHLPEMVQTVKQLGMVCVLSTNLNILKHEDDLLASSPDAIRVSMSGFTQENYGLTHKGGDVHKVMENLERLTAAKARTGASTDIHIMYHRYLGNLDDEAMLRDWATARGIGFQTSWAYFMPLEKVLAYAYKDGRHGQIVKQDREILDRLALPINDAIEIATRHRQKPCRLLENQLVMDINGNVVLCCSVYDQAKYTVGNFLERPLADIVRDKHQLDNCRDLCQQCTQKGLHIYATYSAPEFEEIAISNISNHYGKILKVDTRIDGGLMRYLVSTYAPWLLKLRRNFLIFARKYGLR